MMYHRLENSIIDVIKEEQAKLGYRKEEIRLYYPLSSLDHFFETEADAEEMKKILAGFGAYTKEKLGNVLVSNKGDRFCFHIPEQGAEYVHQYVEDPPFLVSIIQLFGGNHHLTIEEICMAFEKFNPNYICQKMEEGMDFDYVLYFPDETPDAWYYCIRMEMGHTIYHRFSKEDYLGLTKI